MGVIEFIEKLAKPAKENGICATAPRLVELKEKIKYIKGMTFYDDAHFLSSSEKRLLGISLSTNKIDVYNDERITHKCHDVSTSKPYQSLIIGVEIKEVKEYITKKGENEGKKWANLIVADNSAKLRVTVWSTEYEQYYSLLIPNNCVVIKGEKGYGKYSDNFIAKAIWQP